MQPQNKITKRNGDYILQIRVKNGPLLRAMRAKDFNTAAQLAEASGARYATILALLALRVAPLKSDGRPLQAVLLIEKTLGLPWEFLFPERHYWQGLSKAEAEITVSSENIALNRPLDQEATMIEADVAATLRGQLRSLPPKTERIIRLRFGMDDVPPQTYEEIAVTMDISRERVRQIELKGLAHLRHAAKVRQMVRAGCAMAERWSQHRARVDSRHSDDLALPEFENLQITSSRTWSDDEIKELLERVSAKLQQHRGSQCTTH